MPLPPVSDLDLVIERLRRARRFQQVAWLVFVGMVILGLVMIVAYDWPLIGGGAGGATIGVLICIPWLRLLRELDLTAAEAKALLLEDDEFRLRQKFSLAQLASRHHRYGKIWTGIGIAASIGFIIALIMLITYGGRTSTESDSSSIMMSISFFGGFACFVLGGTGLMMGSVERRRASGY